LCSSLSPSTGDFNKGGAKTAKRNITDTNDINRYRFSQYFHASNAISGKMDSDRKRERKNPSLFQGSDTFRFGGASRFISEPQKSLGSIAIPNIYQTQNK
jgi:hypothetical protein